MSTDSVRIFEVAPNAEEKFVGTRFIFSPEEGTVKFGGLVNRRPIVSDDNTAFDTSSGWFVFYSVGDDRLSRWDKFELRELDINDFEVTGEDGMYRLSLKSLV